MNRKILLIVLSLFICNNSLNAQSLASEQIKNVETSVRAFMSAIAEYSNCNGEDLTRKQINIIELHDKSDGTDLMFNDLFNPENNGNISENYNWGQYLVNIKNDFHNEIDVEFKNISVLNCIVKNGNNSYVYATVDKTLTYKTQKKNYTILISVNLSNQNEIKEVVSPMFYKNSNNGTCDIGIDKTDVANQVSFLRARADEYFIKKDFLNAKNTYLAILNIVPNDLTIKNKIEVCEKLISYQSVYDKAEQLFTDKKYENAKQLYQELLNNQNSDKNSLNRKIELCDQGINKDNFQQQKDLADYYFRVANYEKAREYYSKALVYKPNDDYTLTQIQKSKNGDKTFVRSEIARAVKLAEAGKKNYAEAFKIMTDYELSGLLTTDNYAFLTLMMFSKNKEIKNKLHYTKENFENYLNIYAKKLKEKNRIEPSSQATFLLDEVINKRYQK